MSFNKKELLARSLKGQVDWISIRPQKKAMPQAVDAIEVIKDQGLHGDHYSKVGGKRQVTFIQSEHLKAVAAMLSIEAADPRLTRRNIVISGLNLQAAKDRRFKIGTAVFEYTGQCYPCSQMEENFGYGGYHAMRGHGGITTRVLESGTIRVGDGVELLPADESVELPD
ncbi:MAG: MOSC domain-containing protein [Bacteroidota bacterium]